MRQGYCYTCLAIGGGYLGQVTKAHSIFSAGASFRMSCRSEISVAQNQGKFDHDKGQPAIPQSEVLAKFFEEISEKCGEILAKFFAD